MRKKEKKAGGRVENWVKQAGEGRQKEEKEGKKNIKGQREGWRDGSSLVTFCPRVLSIRCIICN